jgi:type IV secretory pathway VirB10-like protein
MTGRWITAGLVALALTGCNKKEAAKPPPPPTETTAPTSPPTTSTTTTSTTTTTPPTTEAPPPTSGYTAAPPSKWGVAPPAKDAKGAKESKEAAADEKIVKSKVQLRAERDILGTWREQKKKVSVLRFTQDGWVSLQQGGGDGGVRNGKWTADKDGAVHITFSIDGGEATLTAHPTEAATMGVATSSKGPQIWPGYGQVIFQRG